jgi:hypothetical protein
MKRIAILCLLLGACQPAGTDPIPEGEESGTAAEAPAREIRLTSEDGMQELVLTPSGITMSRQGSPRVEITANEVSTTLVVRDSGGRRRAQILVTDGPVALSLLGPDEKDAAVIAGNERDALARVELFGGTGQARAGLAVSRDGKGSMTMIGTALPTPTPAPAVSPVP